MWPLRSSFSARPNNSSQVWVYRRQLKLRLASTRATMPPQPLPHYPLGDFLIALGLSEFSLWVCSFSWRPIWVLPSTFPASPSLPRASSSRAWLSDALKPASTQQLRPLPLLIYEDRLSDSSRLSRVSEILWPAPSQVCFGVPSRQRWLLCTWRFGHWLRCWCLSGSHDHKRL